MNSKLDKIPAVKLVSWKMKIYIAIFILVVFLLFGMVILYLIMSSSTSNDMIGEHLEQKENQGTTDMYISRGVAPEVTRYESFFKEYTKKYGIEEHTDVVMAIAMQESGGRYLDVMQSSESLGLARNTLTDPEKSIDQGVKYFSNVLEQAGGDIELALQAYNMGHGFIDYAQIYNNGKYSQELALDFSNYMARKLGWANYGDPNYVQNVMRYLEQGDSVATSNGDWAFPLREIRITSEFGERTHPITGEINSFHGGLDFGCTPQDDILAVANGDVVEAVRSNVGYGNYVTVKHGESEFSRYAHMTSFSVSVGDKVSRGESLGKCGTTGSSTGNHLHLEHLTKLGQPHSKKVNPKKTLGLE
ncbi:lysozyme family protein [Oceanobacillus polygoni]|uniref:Murein DD-endopeptidase MepM/ murein hydrolase activator NlpD n=1 Tax=Oceanobacillus polygoni TaxID=1235259 RepID=A0A9X0YXH5_9BACI|nr:lysozyme family protein [Oceanobacillus polygoni]MBP2079776.1 murein DD-endopeptidase MepM/ murein hydrolase activator NlpD [Oceanobacillus polygoni]